MQPARLDSTILGDTGVCRERSCKEAPLAVKIFMAIPVMLTSTLLTGAVWLTKLASFTVYGSLGLGKVTDKCHQLNTFLAQYTFSPFQTWANDLDEANKTSIKNANAVRTKGTPFSMAYLESLKDTGKAIMAVPWLALMTAGVACIVFGIYLTINAMAFGISDEYILTAVFCSGVLGGAIAAGLSYLPALLSFEKLRNITERVFSVFGNGGS